MTLATYGRPLIAGAAALLLIGVLWQQYGTPSDQDGGSKQRPGSHARPSKRAANVDRSARSRTVGSRLAGTVVSRGAAGIAGASVCIRPMSESWRSPDCTRSDTAGQFELRPLPEAGASVLIAAAPGHLAATRDLPPVPGGGEELLTLTLEPGGVEVSGRVSDVLGGPVPEAWVTLRNTGAPGFMTALADEEGRFAVNLTAGQVEVWARAEGFSTDLRQVVAPAGGVQLVLAPASEIVGEVVDGAGQSLAGLTVRARCVRSGCDLSFEATSDGNGEFRIAGVTGGESYEVDALGPDARSETRRVPVALGRSSDAVLLRAERATALTAVVRRGSDACAGAAIVVSGPTGAAAYTEASGAVRFDGLLPGDYRVVIDCPGTPTAWEEIEIDRTPLHREWTLNPGLSVRGRVLSFDGDPVAGAGVACQPAVAAGAGKGAHCVSEADGEFVCEGLISGQYDCAVDDFGDPTREPSRVTLDGASASDVVLRTRPRARIVVSVVPAPADMSSLRVYARGPSGVPIPASSTAKAHVFDGLPLGEHDVYVELPTSGQMRRVRLSEPGQVAAVELAAPERVAIEGVAVDAAGNPWIDAWVSAVPSEPLARSPFVTDAPTLTNERGEFTLPGLAAGTYDVSAWSAAGSVEAPAVAAGAEQVVLQLPVTLEVSSLSSAMAAARARASENGGESLLRPDPLGALQHTKSGVSE